MYSTYDTQKLISCNMNTFGSITSPFMSIFYFLTVLSLRKNRLPSSSVTFSIIYCYHLFKHNLCKQDFHILDQSDMPDRLRWWLQSCNPLTTMSIKSILSYYFIYHMILTIFWYKSFNRWRYHTALFVIIAKSLF